MAGERFYFMTPEGEVVLNGSYRPGKLRQTRGTPQLYRARNQTRIIDLGDDYAEAGPITLTGREEAGTEDELSDLLYGLEGELLTATAYSRDRRDWIDIQRVTLTADAFPEGGSQKAAVIITIIPVHVQTRSTSGFFF